MNIHFILHSPIYTSKLITWIQSISIEENVFIEIASFRRIYIHEAEQKKQYSFFQAKRYLRQTNIDRAFYHYLSPQMVLLMKGIKVPKSVWLVWGADFYDLVQHRKQYLSTTNQSFHKASFFADYVARKHTIPFINTLSGIAANQGDFNEIQQKLKPPVKHFSLNSLFPIELASSTLPTTNAKILIGNSDDVYNNHLEGIQYLNNIETKLSCIIPLSGVKNNYIDRLKSASRKSHHDFQFIEEFIDKDAFTKLMEEISVVLFPHYRQQGMGTLIPLIMNGRRIILSKKNPLYDLFLDWGIMINSLEGFDFNHILKPLSSTVQTQNAEALNKALNSDLISQQWKSILEVS